MKSIRYKSSAVCTLAFSFVVAQSAIAANYVPSKVLNRLGTQSALLKIITSHRGQYSSHCPENSMCAINAAAGADIESVELDVKESASGNLWLFHDLNVGRTTDYKYMGVLYNPFTSSIANSRANPAVNRLTDAEISKLHLRDLNGTVTGYPVNYLRTTLNLVKTTVPNMMVILDIKTASAVSKASLIVRELGMTNQVLLKFGIGLFTPAEIDRALGGVRFAPTVYLGDLDKIYSRNPLGSPNVVVADYIEQYKRIAGFTYVELGAKEFVHVGNKWGLSGNMANIAFTLRYRGISLGNFAPVIEKFVDFRSNRVGYYRSDGSCCASLSEYYTKTHNFGTETRDDRINIDAEVAIFNNILTDSGAEALRFARLQGARSDVRLILQ